jgi:hypothetical protein
VFSGGSFRLGTFETCRQALRMSVSREHRKWSANGQTGAIDPERTLATELKEGAFSALGTASRTAWSDGGPSAPFLAGPDQSDLGALIGGDPERLGVPATFVVRWKGVCRSAVSLSIRHLEQGATTLAAVCSAGCRGEMRPAAIFSKLVPFPPAR